MVASLEIKISTQHDLLDCGSFLEHCSRACTRLRRPYSELRAGLLRETLKRSAERGSTGDLIARSSEQPSCGPPTQQHLPCSPTPVAFAKNVLNRGRFRVDLSLSTPYPKILGLLNDLIDLKILFFGMGPVWI